MPILNLTQHTASPEQIAAGVIEPTAEERAEIVQLLTFDEQPDRHEIRDRAYELASIARRVFSRVYAAMTPDESELDSRYGTGSCAMIGGAPYLMSALEQELAREIITPLYAFSTRESVEQVQPDGSVRKTAVFRHQGFIQA
jgi:hypothetical protein